MAFVGAGGKTTALFRVARELLKDQERDEPCKSVLVTTTTHLGAWQAGLADQVIHINSEYEITKFEKHLPIGVSLLVGEETNNRLSGLANETLEKVHRIAEDQNLPLLIEADGSDSCPLKAPANHEPVIPEFSKNVVVVAGLLGLGKPLSKDWVHRPEIFAELSGLNPGDTISIDAIVSVLRNKDGGLKNIPLAARMVALLNQADNTNLLSQGRAISNQLIPGFHSVIIASLVKAKHEDTPSMDDMPYRQGEIHAVVEQIAGIILAAGGSSRFGEPKQLLVWKGQPLVRHVVLAAMKAGLSPIVVVVGSSAQEVERVISDLPVRIVNNPDWMTGLSSSIKAGLSVLPKEVGGAIFLKADQPQISFRLIDSLIEIHQETLGPIIAPQINRQRGNPVLFDVKVFPDLLSLRGDLGGRSLFSHFPIRRVIWHDPDQLMDIDTPEDYQKFLKIHQDDEGKA
jgi:molybdenum cofactor cytidylyltransferase